MKELHNWQREIKGKLDNRSDDYARYKIDAIGSDRIYVAGANVVKPLAVSCADAAQAGPAEFSNTVNTVKRNDGKKKQNLRVGTVTNCVLLLRRNR